MPSARGGATTISDLRLAGRHRRVEMMRELGQELLLGLIVPVGLPDGVRPVPTELMRGPACRCPARASAGLLLETSWSSGWEIGVAGVLQDQRLGAVADHHPFAVA